MIKVVAFDWNGTIVNDNNITYAAGIYIIVNHCTQGPYEKLSFKNFRKEFGLPYEDFYNLFKIKITPKIRKEFQSFYNSLGQPKLFSGFKKAVKKINDLGLKTMIITASTNTDSVNTIIKKEGLEQKLYPVFNRVKNKISALKMAAKFYNITTSEIAYVGDMIYDIKCAKEAGAKSIYFLKGFHGKHGLKEKPDYHFKKYKELPEIIKKINESD